MADGVPLVGKVQESGVYPKVFRPAEVTVDFLRQQAQFVRRGVLDGARSSGDSDCDASVWKETLKEADRGWLIGPIPEHELPPEASVSRRFGIWQKSKYRCIDDCSASLINSTCTVLEPPVLRTIDVSAAMLDHWMRNVGEDSLEPLLARSFGLKSAYRQLFLKQEHRSHAFIAVYSPDDGQRRIFQAVALPVGAIQSVYAFLRVARAIWFIATKCLAVCWTNFFDDFIAYSTETMASSTQATIDLLFRLLGWNVAEDNGFPFAESLVCLGVTICLKDFRTNCVTIANTPERQEELAKTVRSILSKGRLSSTDAQRLRGRMQFAENQFMGRMSRRALAAVTEHSTLGRVDISFAVRCHLEDFLRELLTGSPRTLRAYTRDTFYLFTDACFEPEPKQPVGVGCVLVGPEGCPLEFISGYPSLCLCEFLGLGRKKTIIFEAEMYAVVVGLRAWGSRLVDRQLVIYVDNDAVRSSIANSYERLGVTGIMLECVNKSEALNHFLLWVARVPSKSNIADSPSRGDKFKLLDMGARQLHVPLDFTPFQW